MSNFTDAIERNWPDYVIAPGTTTGCAECAGDGEGLPEDASDETIQLYDEGGFSWSECDSCGSTLGGDRFNAHAIHNEAFGPDAKRPDDVYHIEICVDCLMFHANGEEPESWECAA